MNNPWISVVMPTFNGAAYLPAALESVAAQKDPDVEILAIDDGSTDETIAILRSFAHRLRLQIIERSHEGNWVANTNRGMRLARGDWVGFLHQDDLWMENRLARLRALLQDHRDATFVIHPAWYIDHTGARLGKWSCPFPRKSSALAGSDLTERLLVQNFLSMPAPLFRRDEALRLGGLNEALWYTADWDFWLKFAQTGTIVFTPERLAAFRIHTQSQTLRENERRQDFQSQLETVLNAHLGTWEAPSNRKSRVEKAARFSISLNAALAAAVQGRTLPRMDLARQFLQLGPFGWRRYLRDSRIVERISARLRARLTVQDLGSGEAKSRLPAPIHSTALPVNIPR